MLLNILPQVLVDGLTLGFMYAVVALGYTMVYGILEFINFAHGEIFMVGAFVGTEVLLISDSLGALEGMNPYVAFFLTLVIAMALTGGLGVLIERVAYRPLRGAPRLVPLISAIGVSFLLQDLVRFTEAIARNEFYLNTPALFSGSISLGIASIPTKGFIVIVLAIVMMIALTLFINKTKWGIAMRAVAQDQSTASLMTINVDKVIMLTFLIGSSLGGATGVLFSQNYGTIDPYIGFILGLKAFTAAVLGGIGNLRGAMVGGVLLGLLESLSGAYMGPLTNGAFGAEYKDVFAFSILILVLLFKPEGLFGEAVKEKV
ncbi:MULTISPECIES: branched-chain amino acid ABC transporter permease [Brevibacillus]|nr:branched-chain amino acid ABC transporter permease [Brevibacillus borstelensis]KKX56303.1 ABC transporter permease [Brevibacillus borstelensis cifa_chp40]MBE5398390.1 branched-chain amino acid ABC transporter permease [Brevibacillus borstelensis]MCC0564827.1 branched-chain amino acid ABC transporter permease [Brevibacillus borstelensis]MCM3471080.1 branched-chain amino acid ABC transporter permease [Brevibacillus borstelensis]MCM3558261.1 branched-chain amino acid ABC transporter permease [